MTDFLNRRKQEDLAWSEVAHFYNAHQSNVLAALHQHLRQRARTPTSSKTKGKQRASSQELEQDEVNAEPWENELPETTRRGYEAAKQLVAVGADGVGKVESGREEVRFWVSSALRLVTM